jgi:hypothetical protein
MTTLNCDDDEVFACNDSLRLLAFFHERHLLSGRKARLFSCHCCLRIFSLIKDEPSRMALSLAWQWANEPIPIDLIVLAREEAHVATMRVPRDQLYPAIAALAALGQPPYSPQYVLQSVTDPTAESAAQVRILRDLVRYPNQPLKFEPSWCSATVRMLAEAFYAQDDYHDMPILGDALLDAGCDNEEILAHCRERWHWRGCWLVDHILGHA